MPEGTGNVTLKFKTEGAEQAGQAVKGLLGQFRDLRDRFQAAQAAGDGLGAAMTVLSGVMSAAMTPLGALTIGIGALTGVMLKMSRTAQEAVDATQNLMAVSGLTAERAQGLQFAFRASSVSAEGLQTAMFRLSFAIEQQPELLEQLGISARTPGEAFIDLQRKMHDIGDEAKVNAMTLPLLGLAAKRLTPIWKENADEFERLIREGEGLSGVNQDLIHRAAELTREQARLEAATKKARLEFAEFVTIPVETFLARAAAGAARLAHGLADVAARLGGAALRWALPGLGAGHPTAAAAVTDVAKREGERRSAIEMKRDEEQRQRLFTMVSRELDVSERLAEERIKFETDSDTEMLTQRRAYLQQKLVMLDQEQASEQKRLEELSKAGVNVFQDRLRMEQRFADEKAAIRAQIRQADQASYQAELADAERAYAHMGQLIEQFRARAAQEAGIGQTLFQQAVASLQKRGYAMATREQVEAEVQRLQTYAQGVAGRIIGGERFKLEDVGTAFEAGGLGRQMQEFGAGGRPAPFLRSAMEQLGGAFAPTAEVRAPVTAGVGGIYEVANLETMMGRLTGIVGMQQQTYADILKSTDEFVQRFKQKLIEGYKTAASEAIGSFTRTFGDFMHDYTVRKLEWQGARQ